MFRLWHSIRFLFVLSLFFFFFLVFDDRKIAWKNYDNMYVYVLEKLINCKFLYPENQN